MTSLIGDQTGISYYQCNVPQLNSLQIISAETGIKLKEYTLDLMHAV